MTTRWQLSCILLALCFMAIGGCAGVTVGGASSPSYQEQYDLGAKYLSEGNYQEAILAFTAAIEIDPRKVENYVGRGNAYIAMALADLGLESDGILDFYTHAEADYLSAIQIDPSQWEIYNKLVDLYLTLDSPEKAVDLLAQRLEQVERPQTQMLEALLKIPLELWAFTEEFIQPEEFVFAGKPFWMTSEAEVLQAYPNAIKWSESSEDWHVDHEGFDGYSRIHFLTVHITGGRVKNVHYSADLSEGHYWNSEIRGIASGENRAKVLECLGFSDLAIKILRQEEFVLFYSDDGTCRVQIVEGTGDETENQNGIAFFWFNGAERCQAQLSMTDEELDYLSLWCEDTSH